MRTYEKIFGSKSPWSEKLTKQIVNLYYKGQRLLNMERKTPAEELAKKFHETYERLASSFDYETRKESAVSWSEVPENNKELMIAVCKEILEKQQAIHAIVDMSGRIVFNAMTTASTLSEHDAWATFFKAHAHKYPLAEAIEAYKAIGYKCVKFRLIEE